MMSELIIFTARVVGISTDPVMLAFVVAAGVCGFYRLNPWFSISGLAVASTLVIGAAVTMLSPLNSGFNTSFLFGTMSRTFFPRVALVALGYLIGWVIARIVKNNRPAQGPEA